MQRESALVHKNAATASKVLILALLWANVAWADQIGRMQQAEFSSTQP